VGGELLASRTELLDVKPGNSMQLRHIPVGTLVHNIEMRPGECTLSTLARPRNIALLSSPQHHNN
jgi:ribosomal protein L2